MSETQQTFLGFDFGKQRIGVAVGQTLTGTASPLTILHTVQGQPDWPRIRRLIEEWSPDALVVGLPLNMDGSEQDMTVRARRFGNQLAGRFSKAVHFADERLTTAEARNRPLAGNPVPGAHDAVAAQIILECWLVQRLA